MGPLPPLSSLESKYAGAKGLCQRFFDLLCLKAVRNVFSLPLQAIRKIVESERNELQCLGCDPAIEYCAYGCQELVDTLYLNCDEMCLPDGYYYDSAFNIEGCWNEAKPQVKIGVERCGCDAAFSLQPSALLVTCLILLLSLLLLV